MITNELLEEKWKTQQKMACDANYNIKKLLDNAEKSVKNMLKEHNSTLKVADVKPALMIR